MVVKPFVNRIDQYAATLSAIPRTLKADDRKALIEVLRNEGLLDVKKSMETVAQHLGGFSCLSLPLRQEIANISGFVPKRLSPAIVHQKAVKTCIL